MSKYQSLFEVRGKIGAATFQNRKGKLVIGKTSSLDKSRIDTGPEFVRTRENNKEFGGSAKMGKSLRTGLAVAMMRFADSKFTGRLTGTFRRMLSAGTGIRGQRPIEVLANKAQLVGTEFVKDNSFSSVFIASHVMSVNGGRNEVTVDIAPFVIGGRIRVPQGATHWQLVLSISSLSDHVFNPVTSKYEPFDASLNNLNATVESALISVQGAVTAPLQLVATLPGSPVLTPNVGLVACLGIEFTQATSGLPYVLAQDNAMCVMNVY